MYILLYRIIYNLKIIFKKFWIKETGGPSWPVIGVIQINMLLLLYVTYSKEALIIHYIILFYISAKKFKVIEHKFSNKRI